MLKDKITIYLELDSIAKKRSLEVLYSQYNVANEIIKKSEEEMRVDYREVKECYEDFQEYIDNEGDRYEFCEFTTDMSAEEINTPLIIESLTRAGEEISVETIEEVFSDMKHEYLSQLGNDIPNNVKELLMENYDLYLESLADFGTNVKKQYLEAFNTMCEKLDDMNI